MGDGIRVETDGLNKFSDQVHSDVARTIEPGYSDAKVYLSAGVRFGANNASGGVHAAKERYAESLRASTANIERYVDAARIMADAVRHIADYLDRTDGRSAERVEYVRGALASAMDEARQRQAVIDGAEGRAR
jgi:hypothetical protein